MLRLLLQPVVIQNSSTEKTKKHSWRSMMVEQYLLIGSICQKCQDIYL